MQEGFVFSLRQPSKMDMSTCTFSLRLENLSKAYGRASPPKGWFHRSEHLGVIQPPF